MRDLANLIAALKPHEKGVALAYIKLKEKRKKPRKLQLFQLVHETGITDSHEASRRIYGKDADSSFCQLKKRLKADILNVMLLCADLGNDYNSNEIECARMLIQSKMLLNRGLGSVALDMLQKVKKIAVKFEFLEFRSLANHYIEEECGRPQNYVSPHGAQSGKAVHLGNIRMAFRSASSKRKCFNEALGTMSKMIDEKSLEQCRSLGDNLLDLIGKYPAIRTSRNFILLYTLLGKMHIQLMEYTQATKVLGQALRLMTGAASNKPEVLEMMFIASLMNQDLRPAKAWLDEYSLKVQKNPGLQTRSRYYTSCWHFQHFDFKAVIREVNGVHKNGTCGVHVIFWSKVVELLALFELHELDWAEYKIDCLRKYIQNHQLAGNVRYELIFQLAQSYPKHCVENTETGIGILRKFGWSLHRWYREADPLNFEVIDLIKWFEIKNLLNQVRRNPVNF